ncbi:possible short-chain type dehydrogenase/reductase, N-terminal [Rhodococcus jostii RHA1]|uniref:Possible short-chain type dehydrogenase/reductase, N-terminal n=1 Tax=Rhodococcus jostii (strain RHA1) TaxID=101510 RepID=Q0SJM4_RHOJR|nr:possible short-chain type dehydrogenase/reductase, N-terminal [Rhodococcus jostii RHA1]
MKLQDKVAVITGGGSGLGRQGAQLFASEGAKVAVVDIDGDRAEQTAKLVEQQGGTAIAITADVSDEAAVYRSVEATVDQFGKLDIMWANAGVVSRGGVPSVAGGEHVEFQDLTDADWQHVLGVNLSGVVYSCKAAVPAMRANGGGTILATSSAASFAITASRCTRRRKPASTAWFAASAWISDGTGFASTPSLPPTGCRRTS